MKKITLTLLTLCMVYSISLFAQAPEAFKYQAVLRNADGELIAGQDVSLRISVLHLTPSGETVYSEEHAATTNDYGIVSLTIGEGDPLSGDFSLIPWNEGDKFLKIEIFEQATSSYAQLGTFQLLSVPYALFASSASKLGEHVEYSSSLDTLFVVKDHNGNPVFVVYPEGAEVITSNETKGRLGGFAVSGRTSTRGENSEYLVVTPDSTRIYVNEPLQKGQLGGFAVSGRTSTKGLVNDYLFVTGDSTRVYVNEDESKGRLGGFAVSGRTSTKGLLNDYLQVSRDSTRIYIPESTIKGRLGGFAVSGRTSNKGLINDYFNISGTTTAEQIIDESRVIWYPEKSAFLAGELNIPSPDSVGEFSMALGYRNNAIGKWSQAMGYQSIARGPYSTAIGYETIADTNSFAFGRGTKALGFNSFAFGTVGLDSLGTPTSNYTIASGDYSFAFGLGSEALGTGAFVLGTNCMAIGDFSTAAGFQTEAFGFGSTAMGGNNIAGGPYSLAFGSDNQAQGFASVAFGLGNIAEGLQSFVTGKSNTASGVSSVALGISNNVIGDGAFAAGTLNTASETNAIAFGYNNTSSGSNSFTAGLANESIGNSAASFGSENMNAGDLSLVIGFGNQITPDGDAAFAAGFNNEASGQGSIAAGEANKASGKYSVALGYNNESPAYGSFVIGRLNQSRTANSNEEWTGEDPLFVVGNGTGGAPIPYNDAFVIYQNGNAEIDGNFYPVENNLYDLGSSGNRWRDIYTDGAVTTSDSRLKTNILNISYGLATVMKLKPVSFLWKEKTEEGIRLGLIAQEVKPVINEIVVVGDDENQTLGIRYTELIPVLIKSIQEQQEIIDKQTKKNNELKAQLEKITQRLTELEEKVK
ncbi:MAG: tail fiber domain-containing protein [Bacteroidales bacterium]|nr:tail fiber domain-containing protein [Bacteroidales bacterium]